MSTATKTLNFLRNHTTNRTVEIRTNSDVVPFSHCTEDNTSSEEKNSADSPPVDRTVLALRNLRRKKELQNTPPTNSHHGRCSTSTHCPITVVFLTARTILTMHPMIHLHLAHHHFLPHLIAFQALRVTPSASTTFLAAELSLASRTWIHGQIPPPRTEEHPVEITYTRREADWNRSRFEVKLV